MKDRLTPDELAALPHKARRDPEIVALYSEHDYLTAYGLHTDRRVQTAGAPDAAGADASRDNWDSHGELQMDFLVSRGLRPHHRLLDIGCGGGRLARKVVPFLLPGHYHGVDISAAAVASAEQLSKTEGWNTRRPRFWWRQVDASLASSFHYLWAHSVFTHLPPPLITELMVTASTLMVEGGQFYYSYVPAVEDTRYGLMQFRTTMDTLRRCAEQAQLTFEPVPNWVESCGYRPGRWSGEQRVALSRHAP